MTVKFYVTFMSSSYSRQRMVQGRTVGMSYLAEAPPPPAVEFDVNCTAAEGQKAIFDMPRLTSERMSFSPGFLPPPRFLGGPPLPANRKSTSRRVFISQMSTAQAPENARGRPGTASCSCQGRNEMGSPAILVQIGSVNVAFQLAFPHFRCCRDVVG